MNKAWCALLLALPGCIRDAGECWVRGEDEGGVGGGVIVGAGAGGFGDVPPEPQGAPTPGDPCVQTAECEVTWTSGSPGCQSTGPGATCRTYYQGQHRSLDEAKAACERAMGVGTSSNVKSCEPCYWVQAANNDCLEHCKDLCFQIWEKCREDCPKGNKSCLAKCTDKLGECNRECDRKCR